MSEHPWGPPSTRTSYETLKATITQRDATIATLRQSLQRAEAERDQFKDLHAQTVQSAVNAWERTRASEARLTAALQVVEAARIWCGGIHDAANMWASDDDFALIDAVADFYGVGWDRGECNPFPSFRALDSTPPEPTERNEG